MLDDYKYFIFLKETDATLPRSKNGFLIDLRLAAIIFLIWAVFPAQLYLHLYYLVHELTALSVLMVFAGSALRKQGKCRLFILAIWTGVATVAAIWVMRYPDVKLMRASTWL